ncbi:MAG: hypothetical protein ACKVUT_06100 [Gaiella sp.]
MLFSRPSCRAILIDLNAGEELGEHRVHEHAVMTVVSGKVGFSVADHGAECGPGALVTFDAGEARTLHALEPSRVLLILAPWPGAGHYNDGEQVDLEHIPAHAAVAPLAP